MSFPTADRYADIIQAIVSGSYYENLGIVIPYRFGNTTFRLETDQVSTEFGVYLNEVFSGSVFSDVHGNVVLKRHLPKGEVEITLLSSGDGRSITAYLSVRDYAIWLAAYAEVLENIDDNIIQTRNNAAIETAELEALQDVFGEPISTYADIGQGLDSYRWQIHELRQAYRDSGGRFRGVEDAVGAFTQVTPFGYSRRKWGPNWILDQSMLVNHRFLDRGHTVDGSGGTITGVTYIKVEPDVVSNPSTPHDLAWDSVTRTFTWTPDGASGLAVNVADGLIYLPGPSSSLRAFALGRSISVTPYIISATSDMLYLSLDGLGTIAIQLVTGLPNPTPTQVFTDINTAFLADPRYLAYGGAALLYNGKLLIESQTFPGSVLIENGVNNAAPELFGVKPGDLKCDYTAMDGVTIYEVLGSYPDISVDATLQHYYDDTLPIPHSIRWKSPVGSYIAYTDIEENGEYTLTDSLGNTLKIHIWLDDLNPLAGVPYINPVTESVTFSLGFSRVNKTLDQTQGMWVEVIKDDLPAVPTNDTVLVVDDVTDSFPETPDHWFIDPYATAVTQFRPSRILSGKLGEYDPASAFGWRVAVPAVTDFDIIGHVHKFPLTFETPRGINFPQKGPGMFYDYEGFEVKFSGWFKGMSAGVTSADLSFSFDGGDNWVTGSITPIAADIGGNDYEDSTYVGFSTVIPAAILYRETVPLTWEDSGVLVKIHFNKLGMNMDVLIEGVSVAIKYITSRSLGNATVSRNRHRQYFGELLWLWAPEELLLQEKRYLGLQHKDISPSAFFGGVRVVLISEDTPIGFGTFEYEYNSVGNIRKFRWQPYGTAYALGVGWVSISSSGTYRMTSPDASYLDVDVVYDYLPNLTGTMPVLSSKSLQVSDATTDQGHVRNISPAHSSIDIFDLTEYDSDSDPYNLKGALTETDFSFCGLINCEIQKADPFKYSYMYPEFEPVSGEELTFTLVGPDFEATLEYYSDEDQEEAILYEDGLPVPNNMWSFTAENMVSVPQSWFISGDLDSSATFTLDYNLLYQMTTTVFDLGVNYQDYSWLVDYYLWQRLDKEQAEYLTETPLYFNITNYRAGLANRSNANKATSNLMVQESTGVREIPKRYWRFIDNRTVEITSAYLVNGQYYLQHYELRVYEISNLSVVFEHRSSTTSGTVELATWSTVEKNDLVETRQSPGHRFHQLRLTVLGIRDLRDFKVRSLVLKGLHLHGSSPDVPGLTNVWTY